MRANLVNYIHVIMKKSFIILSVLALVAIAMTSCFGPSNEPTFAEADLLGLWGRGTAVGQDSVPVKFVRFTSEVDDSGEYKYGREWDEGDDVSEGDLTPYGNGWFKYKLVQTDLTEIHLMDNGGADIPKVYTVITLTDEVLVYEDEFKRSHRLNKVVMVEG